MHIKIQLGAAEGVHSSGDGRQAGLRKPHHKYFLLHRRNERHEENNLRYIFTTYY